MALGGMSDPFQPCEKNLKITKQLLDVTNKYGIHVLFSTKSDTTYDCIEIYTDEGDVVIDPVAGSCSTLRACAELKRSCYGFEIKKNFYNQAKEKMLSNVETQLF